jgi:hypothetical protein
VRQDGGCILGLGDGSRRRARGRAGLALGGRVALSRNLWNRSNSSSISCRSKISPSFWDCPSSWDWHFGAAPPRIWEWPRSGTAVSCMVGVVLVQVRGSQYQEEVVARAVALADHAAGDHAPPLQLDGAARHGVLAQTGPPHQLLMQDTAEELAPVLRQQGAGRHQVLKEGLIALGSANGRRGQCQRGEDLQGIAAERSLLPGADQVGVELDKDGATRARVAVRVAGGCGYFRHTALPDTNPPPPAGSPAARPAGGPLPSSPLARTGASCPLHTSIAQMFAFVQFPGKSGEKHRSGLGGRGLVAVAGLPRASPLRQACGMMLLDSEGSR